MDEQFEIVISRLAKLVECDPAIVQIYYDQHKISEALDTQDSSRLVSDADKYSLAYDKVRSARTAISNLSDFEKSVLLIEEFELERSLKDVEAFLSKKDKTRRAMRAEFSIQGGKNVKANAVANMVLDLFVYLNLEISLAKTSETKNSQSDLPSSKFAICVDQALKITHTDGRLNKVKFEDIKGRTVVRSHSQYAHWKAPATQAVKLLKKRTSKKQ
ncbi:hypothetical protein N8146_09300 [Ascidiaceihabitans sp.]|nr:hypothetical protein [Ascidiaceihabitans sp.]